MTASTVNRTNYSTERRPFNQAGFLNAPTWLHTLETTSIDETNDTINMGYIPANSKLIGFFAGADDLDSGTSLVWKIKLGSTDVHTGLTIGQAASNVTNSLTQFVGIKPTELTADTLVSIVVTTAAGTPVAGDIWLTPVYTQL